MPKLTKITTTDNEEAWVNLEQIVCVAPWGANSEEMRVVLQGNAGSMIVTRTEWDRINKDSRIQKEELLK